MVEHDSGEGVDNEAAEKQQTRPEMRSAKIWMSNDALLAHLVGLRTALSQPSQSTDRVPNTLVSPIRVAASSQASKSFTCGKAHGDETPASPSLPPVDAQQHPPFGESALTLVRRHTTRVEDLDGAERRTWWRSPWRRSPWPPMDPLPENAANTAGDDPPCGSFTSTMASSDCRSKTDLAPRPCDRASRMSLATRQNGLLRSTLTPLCGGGRRR